MSRSRGEIIAAAQAATTAAVARGALTEAGLRRWQTRAEAGEDVAGIVDQLAAVLPAAPQVAAARTHAPAGADPGLYAANPLLGEMRRSKPALAAAAEAEAAPPRLFGTSDLPPFTASGLDPQALAALPWPIRRAVASAPDLKTAYEIAGKYEGNPEMAHADHAHAPENAGYVSDFSRWLAGTPDAASTGGTRPKAAAAPQPQYTTEALHRELFGTSLPEPRKPPEVPRPR